jgi:Cysteine rich repeat
MLARRVVVAGLFTVAALVAAGSDALAAADPLTYCKSDVARLCPGVQPGGGRIIGCLKEHQMEVSVGCAKAIQEIKAQMGK